MKILEVSTLQTGMDTVEKDLHVQKTQLQQIEQSIQAFVDLRDSFKGEGENINMSVILLVVEQDGNEMKYLPIIRNNTNLGFSEIKKRIGNGSPIMECNLFIDDEDDTKLKKLINELINVGAQIRLFDGELVKNKEVSVEYLMNRFGRYKEIQKQNEMLDDLMFDED